MAAAGQPVALPTAAMSPVSAAGAAGPMQAKKGKNKGSAPEGKQALPGARPSEGDLAAQAAAVARQRNAGRETPKEPEVKSGEESAQVMSPQDFRASLGSANMRQGTRYDRMMGSLDIIQNLQAMKGSMDRDNAEYILPAYSRAIADMKKYRKELKGVKDKADRKRQMEVLDAVLAQAKADEKRIRAESKAGKTKGKSAPQITSEARTRKLQDADFKDMHGGNVNQVYEYGSGFYKPHSEERFDYSEEAMEKLSGEEQSMRNGEVYLFEHTDIRHGRDESGNTIDTHMAEREIAAARLDKLLGGNVIVDAERAEVGADSSLAGTKRTDENGKERTFSAQGTRGILMETAKGHGVEDYDWQAYAPELEGEDKEQAWMDRAGSSTVGERLKERKDYKGLQKKKFGAWTGGLFKKKEAKAAKGTLDTADPKLQRDMNALFLEDLLMVHPDRHGGNFKIATDEKGQYAGLKGIDNDSAFGERTDIDTFFGENGGLPEQMHIDRAMANRIRAVDGNQLELLFSDLLSKEEIDAMKDRFQQMSTYIDEMEKKGLLVDEWNEQTAQEQMLASKGKGFRKRGERRNGNTYYQRMLGRITAWDQNKDAAFS